MFIVVPPKLIDQARSKHHNSLIVCRNTKSSPVAAQDKTDFAKVCSFPTSDAPVDVEKDLQDISTLTISTTVRDSEIPNNDSIPSDSSAHIPSPTNDDKVKTELDDWLEDILH